MNRKVALGLIQMSCSEDIRGNNDKAVNLIKEAAQQGAQIICTQELFKSLYFCQSEDSQHFDLAEEIDANSPTVEKLSELAAELGIVLIASLFEKRAMGLYHNTTVVLDADRGYLGKYRKMHIPDDPHYYEKFYFAPGDLGYQVFHTKYADIGVLICWDQWYPEAARLTALGGADLLLYPTAIGWHPAEKAEHGDAQRGGANGEQLRERVNVLLAQRFGASAEKVAEAQLGLFNEAEELAAQADDDEDADDEPASETVAVAEAVAMPPLSTPSPSSTTSTSRRS